MSFAGFSKVVKVFKRNKTKLPVPIKKGTQLIDADSNVAYEFNGDEWVVLPFFYAELSDISSSSDRDAIRRANERERACKSVPYSTAKEYPDNNARRGISAYRSDDSTNDFTNQMLTAVTADILSDYPSSRSSRSSDSYSSSCSSYDSSSSSSYSSDSGSSCDSSSSSSCD